MQKATRRVVQMWSNYDQVQLAGGKWEEQEQAAPEVW